MSYLVQLGGWVLLQAAWQTLAIGLVLLLSMGLLRNASAERRYRCATLHLAAAIGAVALALATSHASVAAAAGLTPVSKVQARWVPLLNDETWPLLPILTGIWLGGIVITQAWLAVRLFHLVRLVRSSAPAAGEIAATVHEMSFRTGLSRPPEVRCADVQSPMVAGWRSSFIVVPCRFSELHPPAEARALLAHEIAHVARRDYARNILQLWAASLLWWHPGIWLIYARIRHERECLSDEHAVRLTGSAAGLANGLFRLAAASVVADATLVAADAGRLADRISRISDPPAGQTGAFAPLLLAAAGVVFMAIVIAASATARRGEALTRAYAASALSPHTVVTIHGADPGGTFLLQMVRGRVTGIVLGKEPVPPNHVVQRGDTVTVVGQAGQELLRLEIDPRGRCRWKPRRAS